MQQEKKISIYKAEVILNKSLAEYSSYIWSY